MKKDSDDEWLIHAIGRSTWPEPSRDLHHKIMMQAQQHTMLPIAGWTARQIYAGFTAMLVLAFCMGLFYSRPVNHPVESVLFYESDSGYEWLNLTGNNA